MRILVIGGGVSGLTTARVLLAQGHEVTVRAREWAPHIVSSVAAAIWHPFQAAHEEATQWALRTREILLGLAEAPQTGVRLIEGWQLHRAPSEPPAWATSAVPYHPLAADLLPPEYACGFHFELPVIETPIYMQWLHDETRRAGATFEEGEVHRLEELFPAWPLVINCTGLGARELAGDESLLPIRGQIVRVTPGVVDRFFFDEDTPDHPTYLIPRQDGVIVGGTTLRGDWDTAVRPETTEAILERARALFPSLADAEILDVLVGLRPGRPTVRLEAEAVGDRWVIHNYGHGGSGYTLSWGCAEKVASLVEQLGAGADG